MSTLIRQAIEQSFTNSYWEAVGTEGILDWCGDDDWCSVHETRMQPIVVHWIQNTHRKYSSDYYRASEKLFPNIIPYRFRIESDRRIRCRILYCPECETQKKIWIKENRG